MWREPLQYRRDPTERPIGEEPPRTRPTPRVERGVAIAWAVVVLVAIAIVVFLL
jgi:hypothetical protein